MDSCQKTIFLVDDDPTNLTLGADAISICYNVFTFNSGSLLLKRLNKQIPDLILLDIEMPEMNGYETIKLIKENSKTSNIPVIFLTAKSDCESELDGLSLGAIDYITKPFSPPLLLKRIEVHLLVESQKAELQNFNNNLLEMVDNKTKNVVELQSAILQTMTKLVDQRDDITGGHLDRSKCYMSAMLNAMRKRPLYTDEMSSWDFKLIEQSTQLHDIGKIAIKDNILLKSEKLTDEEFDIIKQHTTFGEEVIMDIQKNTSEHAFLEYAMILVGTHHEKWDGSGYPKGLKGEEIPLLGRIMAVIDVYDALVSNRPYKKGITHEEAVAIISETKGSHFDPEVTDTFLTISEEFKKIAADQNLKA